MKVFDTFYSDQEIRLIGVSVDKVVEQAEKEDNLLKDINGKLKEGGTLMKGSDLQHEN